MLNEPDARVPASEPRRFCCVNRHPEAPARTRSLHAIRRAERGHLRMTVQLVKIDTTPCYGRRIAAGFLGSKITRGGEEKVMAPVVAVIAPGMMGAGVGKRLVDNGVKVLTSLTGRSAETVARAKAAGMQAASDEEIAASDF